MDFPIRPFVVGRISASVSSSVRKPDNRSLPRSTQPAVTVRPNSASDEGRTDRGVIPQIRTPSVVATACKIGEQKSHFAGQIADVTCGGKLITTPADNLPCKVGAVASRVCCPWNQTSCPAFRRRCQSLPRRPGPTRCAITCTAGPACFACRLHRRNRREVCLIGRGSFAQ
jgi:hypothetical protein